MSEAIVGAVMLFLFLMVTSLTFQFMLTSWNTQNSAAKEFTERQVDRLNTGIGIETTADASSDCLTYTAQVANTGETKISDFTEMDVLVQYTNSGDTKVASRLAYNTDWTISMSPDDRDANIWNPDETATITFSLASAPKLDTRGTVVVVTPQGVLDSNYFRCICTTGNTGFKDPTAEAADTGGNGDGFELNPTQAFADDASSASNIGGDSDRHRFYNYGFSVSNSCAISGIEVRLDWWLNSLGGSNSMDVELSWDAGSSWTAAKTDTVESTTQHTTILGSPTDTWGRTWTASDFSNSNFRLRLTTNGVGGRSYFLDWVPVKVYYAPS